MRSKFGAAMLGLLCFAAPARADFMVLGDPVGGGSWSARFTNTSGQAFTHIAVIINTGPSLETPGITGIMGAATWTNRDFVTFLGNSVAVVSDFAALTTWTADGVNEFTINFSGDISTPTSFLISGYFSADDYLDPSEILDSNFVDWDGSIFTLAGPGDLPQGFGPINATMIPLPPAVWLGSLGLLFAIGVRRRIK